MSESFEEGAGRTLTIFLVASAVIAAVYLYFGRAAVPEEDATDYEPIAAAWARDSLRLSVKGTSCMKHGRCTISVEGGAPFAADCRRDGTCTLARQPAQEQAIPIPHNF